MMGMKKNDFVAFVLYVSAATFGCSQNVAAGQSAGAHESQPVDAAVMFRMERVRYTSGSSFWAPGGSGELAFHLKYNFGLVANATGETSQGSGGGQSFSKVMVTGGPRYTLPLGHAMAAHSRLFVEGLFGGVHGFDSTFPGSPGPVASANALAMQFGGGWDWNIRRTWAIRVVDAHYVRTDLPNGFSNRQQDFQIGAGVVWRPVDSGAR
jgi:hypothetical protein